MTDHLPECPNVDGKWPMACICDRLRACEARVLSVAGPHNYSRGRKDGYAAGVQAARDAVAAQQSEFTAQGDLVGRDVMQYALAAIDALRGE